MTSEHDDRHGTREVGGAAAHPGPGTPVPDDAELLPGDARTTQDLLGVGEEGSDAGHSLLDRARHTVHRATAAAAHAGDAGLDKVRQAADHAWTGPADIEKDWEDAVLPVRRSPYLIAAGVTAGALIVWAVLRRRR